MFRAFVAAFLAALLFIPSVSPADTAKGRIEIMSFKAKSIQIWAKDKPPVVVRFDKNTQFVNVKSAKELVINELIDQGDPFLSIRITPFVERHPVERYSNTSITRRQYQQINVRFTPFPIRSVH